ncbi:MAG: hypothetical protein KZQ98_12190 [Candidatus Thiodiazotropha sp. (ex Lucinoma borealis)]|nr:hypothetical protein [Candidatus Thiodiazotropha sp. (ex Lucinoma borealis)]
MESWEEEMIRSLKNKYHVSDYQLMEYLEIKFKNGLYYVGESEFDSYYTALKAADIEYLKNINKKQKDEEPIHNKSSSLLSLFFKGILLLLFTASLFFLILPLTAQIMVMIFGKMGGSILGYIASLISVFMAFLISSVIVARI